MKKLKIVEKAYKINHEKINEGYYLQDLTVYADNINKAKSKLLEKIKYDDYVLRFSGELVTYLNIPVIRDPESDKIEFEGGGFTKYQIKLMKERTERLEKLNNILLDDTIKYCYIYKGGYYMSNWCGYTDFKDKAGVYSKEEAIEHSKNHQSIRVIPINIETHNAMINERINDLKSRLIVQ